MKIPTKNMQISVRFKTGVPALLTKLAAKTGERRAAWMRRTLLERVEAVLNGHDVLPLHFSTANGAGESLLLRLTPAELKRSSAAAKKEHVLLGGYIRAVCTRALEDKVAWVDRQMNDPKIRRAMKREALNQLHGKGDT